MPSDDVAIQRWLNDIQHHIGMAQGFVAGMSYETFKNDNLHLYAVTRCLEIISEASRRLPPDFKQRFPEIPWKEVAGSGGIYRHNYENVQSLRIWRTIHEALPALRAVVDAAFQA